MKTGDLVEIHCHYGATMPEWAKGHNLGAVAPYARVIQLGNPAVIEVLRNGKHETVPLNWLHPARTMT